MADAGVVDAAMVIGGCAASESTSSRIAGDVGAISGEFSEAEAVLPQDMSHLHIGARQRLAARAHRAVVDGPSWQLYHADPWALKRHDAFARVVPSTAESPYVAFRK